MSKIIKRSFCAEMRAVEDTEQTNEMIVEGYALRMKIQSSVRRLGDGLNPLNERR